MKILIIKSSSLGDIIHTFPVVHYLRHLFPKAQIDWVAEEQNSELLEQHSQINRVWKIKTRQWRKGKAGSDFIALMRQLRKTNYDYLFDLQGNFKSGLVTLFAKAKEKVGFGRKKVHEWPNLLFTNRKFDPPDYINVRDELLFVVQSAFKDFSYPSTQPPLLQLSLEQENKVQELLPNHPKTVLVCAGSMWRNKRLTDETLLEFLQQLDGYFLFAWGSEQEKYEVLQYAAQFPGRAQVLERLSLPMLQHLMGQVKLVVAMDSLPLHLAGTTATPTFSVFGSSSAFKYCPKESQHIHLQGSCPYGRSFERRCPILRTCPTGNCIRSLKAEQLIRVYKNQPFPPI